MPADRGWALVTAASSGLGQSMSRHLLGRGYRLFLQVHQNTAPFQDLLEDPRVRLWTADLAKAEQRKALVSAIKAETGSLALLLHNLGVYPELDLLETSLAVWERTLNLSLTAAFDLSQALLPWLRAHPEPARMLFIGDSGADRIEARRLATPYHVAKLGIAVLNRSYAQALAADRITVNMISPGFMEGSVGEPGEPLAIGRAGRADDLIGALDYLLSSEASYVSGTNLLVSGGWNL